MISSFGVGLAIPESRRAVFLPALRYTRSAASAKPESYGFHDQFVISDVRTAMARSRCSLAQPSLRANGSRECAPDDRLREAIHCHTKKEAGLLRRCAPRNDDKIRLRDPAARCARVVLNPTPQKRAWGTPDARCTRSLACESKKHTSIVTTGSPVSPGVPTRNGFNGLFRALPGDRALLSP